MPSSVNLAALAAMLNNVDFSSNGFGCVAIATHKATPDTTHYQVSGREVFSVSFAGDKGTLNWSGFNGVGVGPDSRVAAVDALDFMFDTLGVSASAEIKNNLVQVCGLDVKRGTIKHDFDLAVLSDALDACKPRQRMRH